MCTVGRALRKSTRVGAVKGFMRPPRRGVPTPRNVQRDARMR
jgi:hypothetical protein